MLAVAKASPRMVRTVRVGRRVKFFSTNVEKYREGVCRRTKFRAAMCQWFIENSSWDERVRFSEKVKTTVIEPIRNPNLTDEDLATHSRLSKRRLFYQPDSTFLALDGRLSVAGREMRTSAPPITRRG